MKKLVVILFSLLLVTSAFADFTWAQMNLYQGVEIANGFGDTYNDMYLEIEGGGRTGIMNLYYFFDVNTFMGLGDDPQGKQGSFFTKINPRFSLKGFVPEMGPVKELYVATQYKGYNGGANYYAGLGSDLAIPFFERFSANFYMMMEHVNDPDDADKTMFENAGFVFAINWYTTLYKFDDMMNVSYQGWSDYGFANAYTEDMGDPRTADEFQMFNGFFFNYNKWSVSASLKLHNHFMYTDASFGNHDAMSYFFGLHRRF
jgi:nucleoside-specific channel-forming protein